MLKSKPTVRITSPQPDVVQFTLNRPAVRNAINTEMMQDLRDLWRELSDSKPEMRCVVLTGDGERAFCAGADLKERREIDVDTWRNHHTLLESSLPFLLNSRTMFSALQPTVRIALTLPWPYM